MAGGKRDVIPPEQLRAFRRAKARAGGTAALAFFIMGLSVMLSFNATFTGLTSYGWYVVPIGVVVGVAIFVAGGRWAKSA